MSSEPREKDRPWLMRTYSGHSSAKASNELYRSNLAKGQTGLSVAFDLPTQTGYDADHVLARGEVGKVGVPVCSIDDMRTLFDGIPLEEMNTSMTINATAPWLLALYIATAEENGVDRASLRGTTQNDIIKEYLSRGTYVFGPAESLRLTADVVTFTVGDVPKWNPVNICSYHLQEVGATPVQEVAFAMATATAVLDEIRSRGVEGEDLGRVFGRISFFVNAGIRFVDEIAKLRAMSQLWDELGRERYGVENPKYRRFRYGVQVNSLGLTEAQPENNIARIVLEMLAVTLSKDARARAVQLPAWNEALGLPRPWDQQLSLRMQQILANETDLLEHGDLFNGSHVMEARTAEIADAAREEYDRVTEMGGSVQAVDYMKAELVRSNTERMRRIESGEQVVVGVNAFTGSEPSPLMTGVDGGILKVDPASEAEQVERLQAFRAERDNDAVASALAELRRAVAAGENVMPASIAAAKAGVTTGEWTQALRDEWGTYRGPTGVSAAAAAPAEQADALQAAREAVARAEERVGGKVRLLVGKPGLDGHSSGAEQIAVRARDAGFEVIYEGIRLTPGQIVRAAVDEDVHLIGLSILSGSHGELIPEVLEGLAAEDAADIPVVVGGIIPTDDAETLRAAGVAAVYTPKDFEVSRLIAEMAELVKAR
ncbi:Ethylmalonyl-CoA mutase, methylsuccinyl-CoA-forming [Euzebya pacifica]|uniref:Ethylmalonyl-CoA mutase, methylsuccinyl-CoA-forming n=1 Tax=Euzebya pacifica TaxID=1608957 RepID=A0A346Y298_9ACTN|nr:protein meaA [Euzebya pacifica]AXV08595.1 Ethylmalonyl-CoA mutase, methylsuccinyl-CoA-forming [Euzebya pacifica]